MNTFPLFDEKFERSFIVNTFHDISDAQKLSVVRKYLKGKVKCSECDRHYDDLAGLHRLGKGVHRASIEQLRVSRWIGFDEPESITMNLVCLCGHGGPYILTPNPFIG